MDSTIYNQIVGTNAAISKATSLYGKWAKKNGLNYNSLMVLYAMEGMERCTQKDICDKWMLPKTTVSTILSDFRKKGFITFLTGADDKREKIIVLTKTGQAFSNSILTKIHEVEKRTMQKMGSILCEQMLAVNITFSEIFELEVENE